MEQLGTKITGSTTFKKLFKSSLGPTDIISAVVPGNSAATYGMGVALVNHSTSGLKKKYTNATVTNDAVVGSGNGSTKTFDLTVAAVIGDSLKAYVAGAQQNVTLSAGTGTGGVDQLIFNVAPASGTNNILADFSYHADTIGATGACVNMYDAATIVGGPQVTLDGARDGSVDSLMVLDSAGNAVDKWFKAALPRMSFD